LGTTNHILAQLRGDVKDKGAKASQKNGNAEFSYKAFGKYAS